MLSKNDDWLLDVLSDIGTYLETSNYTKTAGCLASTMSTLKAEMTDVRLLADKGLRELDAKNFFRKKNGVKSDVKK